MGLSAKLFPVANMSKNLEKPKSDTPASNTRASAKKVKTADQIEIEKNLASEKLFLKKNDTLFNITSSTSALKGT